jgi:copper chaperone CopZ
MQLMKPRLVIVWIFLVIFLSGCTGQNDEPDTQANITATSENMRIVEISLSGMYCQSCAKNAEIAFRGMDGVFDATVDIETKKGVVVYESVVTSKEQLIQNPVIQAYDGKILSDQKYIP